MENISQNFQNSALNKNSIPYNLVSLHYCLYTKLIFTFSSFPIKQRVLYERRAQNFIIQLFLDNLFSFVENIDKIWYQKVESNPIYTEKLKTKLELILKQIRLILTKFLNDSEILTNDNNIKLEPEQVLKILFEGLVLKSNDLYINKRVFLKKRLYQNFSKNEETIKLNFKEILLFGKSLVEFIEQIRLEFKSGTVQYTQNDPLTVKKTNKLLGNSSMD